MNSESVCNAVVHCLGKQQLTNPFPESGIGHDSKYPNGLSPWQAIMVYTHVLCLVEAAYRLYTDQQTQLLKLLNSIACMLR